MMGVNGVYVNVQCVCVPGKSIRNCVVFWYLVLLPVGVQATHLR